MAFKCEVRKRLEAIEANQRIIINRLANLATEADMADLKTDVAKVEADLTTIKAGIAGLNTQIQALNDKLNAGTVLSAEDATALDKLAGDADDLASQFPQAPPAPPAAPGS